MDVSSKTTQKNLFISLKRPVDKSVYNTKTPSVYPETVVSNLVVPDPIQVTNVSSQSHNLNSLIATYTTANYTTISSHMTLSKTTTKIKIGGNQIDGYEVSCLNDVITDIQAQINSISSQVYSIQGVATGTIIEYAGYFDTISPFLPGYLFCDGKQFNKSQYSSLYAIVGDIFNLPEYDVIDGPLNPNNFRVPDLQGLFTRMTTFNTVLSNIKIYNPITNQLITSGPQITAFTPNLDGKKYLSRIPYHSHSYQYFTGNPTYEWMNGTSVITGKNATIYQQNESLNLQFEQNGDENSLTNSNLQENVPSHFSVYKFIKT